MAAPSRSNNRVRILQPAVLSPNMIGFLEEADLGPLYDKEGNIVLEDLKETLFFLNKEIEGSPNITYGIGSLFPIESLFRIYLEYNDLYQDKSPNHYTRVISDKNNLIHKYFTQKIDSIRERNRSLAKKGSGPNFDLDDFTDHELNDIISREMAKIDRRYGNGYPDVNPYADVFNENSLTGQRSVQFNQYFDEIAKYGTGPDDIPFIDIACQVVGECDKGVESTKDNLEPIYKENPIMYIHALLNNLQQDLNNSEEGFKKLTQGRGMGYLTKSARNQ